MLGRRSSLALASSSRPLLLQRSQAAAAAALPLSARRAISGAKPQKAANASSIVEADTGAVGTKYYHILNHSLLLACPLALILSPSVLTFPIDLFLGVALPLHGHVGLNYVISDYVPKASRPLARYVLLGVTGVTVLGLLKLNLTGPGITEAYKSLWREEKGEAKEEKKEEKK